MKDFVRKSVCSSYFFENTKKVKFPKCMMTSYSDSHNFSDKDSYKKRSKFFSPSFSVLLNFFSQFLQFLFAYTSLPVL